jgi:hypothetical protein
MSNISKILTISGLLLGIFSALAPFMDFFKEFDNPQDVENMIYFRGIMIGFLLCSISSAIIFFKDRFVFSMSVGLGSGLCTLLILSTYNLICDKCIQTQNYFTITFLFMGIGFITALINYAKWKTSLFRHHGKC